LPAAEREIVVTQPFPPPPEEPAQSYTTILTVLGGVLTILVIVLVVVLVNRGDGDGSAANISTTTTTTAPEQTTSTAATPAPTTTTVPATTLPSPTSTTAAPPTPTTTTIPPFDGTTDTKSGGAGDSDSRLVEVRVGKHPGFTRVVWEMDGSSGTPLYDVGLAAGPFGNVSGNTVPVDGNAFIHVRLFPGMRWDISDPNGIVQTYFGPEEIDVGIGSIVEVVFLEDFEANMEWVIGLTTERPFKVFTLESPTRLAVDVAD
jgi:hypothetical protein